MRKIHIEIERQEKTWDKTHPMYKPTKKGAQSDRLAKRDSRFPDIHKRKKRLTNLKMSSRFNKLAARQSH